MQQKIRKLRNITTLLYAIPYVQRHNLIINFKIYTLYEKGFVYRLLLLF